MEKSTKKTNEILHVIPQPKKAVNYGANLLIKPVYLSDDESFDSTLLAFSELSDRIFGLEFTPLEPSELSESDESLFTPLTESGEGGSAASADKSFDGEKAPRGRDAVSAAGIVVKKVPSGEFEKESGAYGAYRIKIDGACLVEISDREGLCSALSVLLQLARRTCDNLISLPKCEIEDAADSAFRALSIDVARRRHPISYLYRYVELCFMFRVNRLIVHFTDDESYTLPSKAFPRLATRGRRYTEEELSALIEYAHSLGVMLIPEIDMPGHCAQMMKKYPEVFGSHGITDASEETFSALGTLYCEAASLFKYSDYIHIGGDEAVLGRWGDSERTKEYMKKNKISDFVELYGHYVGRICRAVLDMGKTPIVWEGFHKESNALVPKDALVIAWESHYQLAPELCEAGFEILNASWKPMYVVSPWQKWSQREILGWNKYTWDHWWEGSAAYKNKIVLDRGAPVRGGILCAWGDYLKGYESSMLACELEFSCVEPRLAAAAEKLWNTDSVFYDGASDGESADGGDLFYEFEKIYGECFEKLERLSERNSYRGKL